jgi:hypothetical protein
MGKHVFNKITKVYPVALGWLIFSFGQVVHSLGLKLLLLSAARVLPRILSAQQSFLHFAEVALKA